MPFLALPDEVFSPGLDPQSRVSWASLMRLNTHRSLTLSPENPCVKLILKTRLPEHLPPSYRGQMLRFAYKVMICVQVEGKPPRLLHLPFRVLPSINAYNFGVSSFSAASSTITAGFGACYTDSDCSGSQIFMDRDSNPFRYDNEPSGTGGQISYRLGDGCLSREELHPAVYDKLSQLFSDMQVTANGGQTKVKKRRKKKDSKRMRNKSPSRSPSAMFAELVSSSSVGKVEVV